MNSEPAYDRIVVTNEVLDDWLAQSVGLDINNIPDTRPQFLSVLLIREKGILPVKKICQKIE